VCEREIGDVVAGEGVMLYMVEVLLLVGPGVCPGQEMSCPCGGSGDQRAEGEP
jgi:hypothetical protein